MTVTMTDPGTSEQLITFGVGRVQNTEFPTTGQTVDIDYGSRIYPIAISGGGESCSQYGRIDQELNQNRWLHIWECTDGGLGTTGADASGGILKVFHSGNSDALDIIIMDGTDPAVQPVGVEVASYKPGSRNFISTLQYIGGSPVDAANMIFYAAQMDTPVVSNFGQFLAIQSPGHALTVNLYDGINGGGPAANPGQASLRIVTSDYTRNLWTVFNSGRVDLSAAFATVGSPINNSPELTLIGTRWDGAASQDRAFQVVHQVTAASPADSAAFFKIGDLNSEVDALIMRNNNGVVTLDFQDNDLITVGGITMQGGGFSTLDMQLSDILNVKNVVGTSYARMLGFAADGDANAVVGTFMLTNVVGVGDGANTNLQAPALGTGTGPTSLTATGFMKAYNGATPVWIPFYE